MATLWDGDGVGDGGRGVGAGAGAGATNHIISPTTGCSGGLSEYRRCDKKSVCLLMNGTAIGSNRVFKCALVK